MNTTIPVNPEVLKWARETAGLTIDDVVLKIKRKTVTYQNVVSWELGYETPSYAQLERLAYEIYKRPLAIFFFPSPPEEVTPDQSFRTLPAYEIEHIPAKIRLMLRRAQAYQFNLNEMYDGVNASDKKIANDISFHVNDSIISIGEKVRKYLSVTVEAQKSFGNSENAFKEWRRILENLGLFIFKDAFQSEGFSGFCLYDEKFPVIYINNSKPFSRQIFTLFHELAHILFKTGGVDTNIESYINYLHGDSKKIEIICNSFAGEFLVPSADFDKKTSRMVIDDQNISLLANTYYVSREVILRKFFDQGKVNQKFYDEKVSLWKVLQNSVSSSSGGNYYFTKGSYLGNKYIEKAFSQYYKERINTERLADYLGVKVKNIPGIESLLYKTGTST